MYLYLKWDLCSQELHHHRLISPCLRILPQYIDPLDLHHHRSHRPPIKPHLPHPRPLEALVSNWPVLEPPAPIWTTREILAHSTAWLESHPNQVQLDLMQALFPILLKPCRIVIRKSPVWLQSPKHSPRGGTKVWPRICELVLCKRCKADILDF